MAVDVSGWECSQKLHVGTKSFGLSCEDAEDKNRHHIIIIISSGFGRMSGD